MQKYCKNLLFVTIGILSAVVFVSCEKPKEYEKLKEDEKLKKLSTEDR